MTERDAQQLFFMQRALALGAEGRLTAPPNPWVGCLLVQGEKVVGEGYHKGPPLPHAEVVALKAAGAAARGATAYVTLEPCSHQGRTPPCTDALIEAGVRKVVIPFLDPDPRVEGKGVAALRAAGIDVVVGIGKEEAAYALAPYLHQRKTQTPFCVLKSAISIDGKSVAADGCSQWITSEEARQDGHHLRAASQAILVGSETALRDKPSLTLHGVKGKQPLRVLIDSQGRVPPEGPLFDPSLGPTLVFTKKAKQKKEGIEWFEHEKLSLDLLLQELGRREVLQLLVEGGARLHAALFRAHHVQRFYLYIGNLLLGEGGAPWLPDFSVPSLAAAPACRLEGVLRLGSSVRLEYSFGQ